MNKYYSKKHNQSKTKYRLVEGLKKVVLPPFLGAIPVILLTLLLVCGLSNRALVFSINSSGLLYQVFDYVKIAALLVTYLTFLFVLIAALGTPSKCRLAENTAMRAFGLQSAPEEVPVLISSKRMKDGSRRWEFYSQWVTMTDWHENIDRICHALGEHLVGELSNGKNNRHRIVFYTKPGAAAVNRGALQDNEF